LRNLLNPDSCIGCKIPDPFTCVPTGTFRLTADLNIGATSSGITNIFVDPMAMAYYSADTIATGAITWNGPFYLPGRAQANQIYTSWRVVSGYVMATYTGSTASDQGAMVGYWMPRNSVQPYRPASFAAAISLARSRILPVREGMQVMYAPEDNADVEFGYQTTLGPFIGIQTSGMATGNGVQFRILLNYEGLANQDTTDFVTTTPSPVSQKNFFDAVGTLSRMADTVRPLWDAWGKDAAIAMGRTAFNGIAASVLNQRRATVSNAPRIMYV